MAALTLARNGVETIVCERSAEIGQPLACAEAISHIGLASFVPLNRSFIATRIRRLALHVGEKFSTLIEADGRLGYVLNRPDFDRHLAQLAIEAGAEVITGAYARISELHEGKGANLKIATSEGESEIRADYLIAADGAESMVARDAGIDTSLPLHKSEATLQYRVVDIEIEPNTLQFYVGKEFAPGSYLWVFPKSDHAANVGLGLNPARHTASDLRNCLDRFLRTHFPQGRIESRQCGLVPKFCGFDILGAKRLLLAGDAARTIDSLSGAGIAKALHTGMLAGETVIGALVEKRTDKEMQERYRRAVRDQIGSELTFYQKIYPIFRKLDDSDWLAIGKFLDRYLSTRKADQVDPVGLVKSALGSAPGLLKLARHLL
jgi:digeranylgeranylglycerophospholipid reductase